MMTPADEEVTYIPTVPPVDGAVFEDETKLESESAPIVGEEENDTLNHDSPSTPTSPTLQTTHRMPPITKIPIEEQRTEWLAHFLHSPSSFHARATHRSVDDRGLRGSLLRGVYWRLFLGELDRSDMFAWSTGLQEKRAAYEALCQKHKLQLASLSETVPPLPVGYRNRNSSTDPDGGENSSAHDLKSNNPLSQAADNPWTSYFADNELSETIRHDLNRTHADSEFFTSEVVQDIMFNILYIWGKEIGNDKEGRYRQGFNEILAPIVLVCMRESQWLDDWKTPSAASPFSTTSASSPSSPSSSSPSSSSNSSIAPNDTLLAEILDRTKVEHDCYGLFVAIMAQIGQYFIRVDVAPTSKDVLAKKRASIMAGETQPANETSPADQTPIIRKCTYIHHILLSTLDPILYDHLVKMDVQPNIYILRWYRLMLSREFHLEDTLVIWDVIFATMERPGENGSGIVGVAKTPIAKSTGSSSPTVASMPLHSNAFVLTEYVCISMLLYVRTALLHGDNVYCLRRLLRYPPVEDIRVLLARALHFLNSWKMITSDPTLTREVFDPTLVTDAERMNSAFDGPWARMQEGMGPDAPLEDSTSSSSPSAAYASSTSSSVASGVGYTSTAAVAKTLISDGLSTLRSFMKGAVAKVGEVPDASSTIPSAGTVSRAQTTTSHTSGGVTKKHATLPAGGVVHAPNRKLPQASGVSHFLTPASLTSSQKSSISSISSTSPQPSSAHPPGTIPSPPTAKEYDELILLRKQLRTVEVERDAALHQVHALQVRSSHSKQLQRHLGQLVEHVTNQLEREWEATSVEATRQKPKRKESTTDAKEAEYTPVPTETPSDAEATDAANLSSNPPVASSFSSSSTATTPPPAPLRPFSEDVLLTGVAELKHIKDVLVGRLTITDVIQHLEATRDDAASAAAASVSSPKGASPLPSRAAILRELTDLHATTQAALPNDDDQAKSSTAFPYNLPAPLPNGGKKRAPLFEPEVASRDAVRDLFALEESDALPGIYPKIVTPVESAKNKNVTGAVAKSGDALNSSLTDPLLSPTQSTSSATPTTLATGAGTPTASTSTPTVSNTKADVTVSSAKSNDLLTGLLSPSPSDESTPTDSSSHLRASSSSSSLFSNSPPSSPFGPTASQSRMKSTTAFSPAFDLEQDDSSILLPKASAFRDPPRAVPKPTAVPKKSTTTNTTAMTATSKPTAAKSLLDDPLSRASTSTTKSKPFSDPLFGDD